MVSHLMKPTWSTFLVHKIPYSRKFSRDPFFSVFAVDWQTTRIKSAK